MLSDLCDGNRSGVRKGTTLYSTGKTKASNKQGQEEDILIKIL